MLTNLETPRLILDRPRLERNARRMTERCRRLGVTLRPHMKTAKSIEVAQIAKPGAHETITVATLQEAEFFAKQGYTDILYAVGLTPNKFERAAAIQERSGARLLFCLDSAEVAQAAAEFTARRGGVFDFLIEVDCGEHRSGLAPHSAEVAAIGRLLSQAPGTQCLGVMTHAGHSYSSDDPGRLADIAETERASAVSAAQALRAAGVEPQIVSVGSTPTVLHATGLDGVTEVRCGIYLLWDLAQFSRGMCGLDDLALSVLATVIGHNRQGEALILDAGSLALSKDISANSFRPDVKFGYVCDPTDGRRLGDLVVNGVHQEHGTVEIADPVWFDRLPIGSPVRILPNHACLTAAAYDRFTVVDGGEVVGQWARSLGWG